MRKKITLTAMLVFLSTSFCQARAMTLAEAGNIIMILIFVVVLLLALGGYGLYYNKVIRQRNEQLRRILNALDDYRAIVGDKDLTLDEQEEVLKNRSVKRTAAKTVQKEEDKSFFVMMDARVNKEKPYTNPDFDYYALIDFMGVTQEVFCQLVPRYKDPDRTADYIKSLRAEYAAKLLMEHSDYSMDEIAGKCGFRNTEAFNSAFKFSFGITPSDYLSGVKQMIKKKG